MNFSGWRFRVPLPILRRRWIFFKTGLNFLYGQPCWAAFLFQQETGRKKRLISFISKRSFTAYRLMKKPPYEWRLWCGIRYAENFTFSLYLPMQISNRLPAVLHFPYPSSGGRTLLVILQPCDCELPQLQCRFLPMPLSQAAPRFRAS